MALNIGRLFGRGPKVGPEPLGYEDGGMSHPDTWDQDRFPAALEGPPGGNEAEPTVLNYAAIEFATVRPDLIENSAGGDADLSGQAGSGLETAKSEVAIESLEIAHEGIGPGVVVNALDAGFTLSDDLLNEGFMMENGELMPRGLLLPYMEQSNLFTGSDEQMSQLISHLWTNGLIDTSTGEIVWAEAVADPSATSDEELGALVAWLKGQNLIETNTETGIKDIVIWARQPQSDDAWFVPVKDASEADGVLDRHQGGTGGARYASIEFATVRENSGGGAAQDGAGTDNANFMGDERPDSSALSRTGLGGNRGQGVALEPENGGGEDADEAPAFGDEVLVAADPGTSALPRVGFETVNDLRNSVNREPAGDEGLGSAVLERLADGESRPGAFWQGLVENQNAVGDTAADAAQHTGATANPELPAWGDQPEFPTAGQIEGAAGPLKWLGAGSQTTWRVRPEGDDEIKIHLIGNENISTMLDNNNPELTRHEGEGGGGANERTSQPGQEPDVSPRGVAHALTDESVRPWATG